VTCLWKSSNFSDYYVSGFRQPHDHRNTKAAGVAQNATGAAQEAAGAHYAPAAQNPRTAGEWVVEFRICSVFQFENLSEV
jgi:hypothetical protein